MIIENQVSNLELSRKLERLGVKQESLYRWGKVILTGKWQVDTSGMVLQNQNYYGGEGYLAYTVAELGEMLTKRSGIRNRREKIMAVPDERCMFDANYWAKMLIYLIENGLLKIKELKY